MPNYLANLTDHWGYDNGNSFTPSFTPSGIYISRNANPNFASRGSLQEITYPTGGKARFDFELGSYSKYVSLNNRTTLIAETGVGGLRVSKIEQYDKGGVLTSKKVYEYRKNSMEINSNISSGVLNNKPVYYIGVTNGVDMSGGSFSFSSFNSNSLQNIADESGVSIGYTEVLEKSLNGLEELYTVELYTNHDNGFTDDNPVYEFNSSTLINKPNGSKAFTRGKNLRSIYYNNQKVKVKSTDYRWSNPIDTLNSSRAIHFNYMPVALSCNVAYYYPSSVSYRRYSSTTHLEMKIDSIVNSNWLLVTREEFKYDKRTKLIKSIKKDRSDGSVALDSITYPIDYGSSAGYGSSALKQFVENSLLDFPVETVSKLGGKVIDASFNEYDFRNSAYILKRNFKLEVNTPVTTFNNAALNASGYSLDNRYVLVNEIISNDSRGNPQESRGLNHPPTTYIWGYKGRYIIAEVKNISYSELETALGQGTLNRLKEGELTEQYILESLQQLRSNPSTKDAIVNSYSYIPFEGVSTRTDANGKMERFIYDELGRLIAILDDQGNFVKTFCYNYGGDQIECQLYFNSFQTRTFWKNDCPSGQKSYLPVDYIVPIGRYSSTISQNHANQKAINEIDIQGQAYANLVGTCSDIPTQCISYKSIMPDSILLDYSNQIYIKYYPCDSKEAIVVAFNDLGPAPEPGCYGCKSVRFCAKEGTSISFHNNEYGNGNGIDLAFTLSNLGICNSQFKYPE